jgi:hypothetical protein
MNELKDAEMVRLDLGRKTCWYDPEEYAFHQNPRDGNNNSDVE